MTDRLPWGKGATEDTFVALMPGGKVFLSRVKSNGGIREKWWHWSINMNGDVVAFGVKEDRQEAADEATDAWPRAAAAEPERQAKLKAIADRKAFVEGLVDREVDEEAI